MNIIIPHPENGDEMSFLSLLSAATRTLGVRVTRMPFHDAIAQNPDVLWIQWPEHLGLGTPPDDAALRAFEKTLHDYRRQGGTIAWTVHNLMPHLWPENQNFRRMYKIVSSLASVHIHLGRASIAMSQQVYPRPADCQVRIGAHGGYRCLLGSHHRAAARERLGLPSDRKILLVFGNLRTEKEHHLLIAAAHSGWYVLYAGRMARTYGWQRHAQRWSRWRVRKNLRVMKGFLPNEAVDPVLKSCDAMLIARTDSLNSGNVFLGMSFSRAIIGPDIGNIAEVLRETGNQLFDPADPASLQHALETAANADLDTLGTRNGTWMTAHAQWTSCGEALLDAITKIKTPALALNAAV